MPDRTMPIIETTQQHLAAADDPLDVDDSLDVELVHDVTDEVLEAAGSTLASGLGISPTSWTCYQGCTQLLCPK